MNYLFISKKLNICSSCLNLISSFGWIVLISLFCYYHINVLKSEDGKEYYSALPKKSWDLNPFNTLKLRTPVSSVQATNMFASAYIAENGLSSFFSEALSPSSKTTYWNIIQPIYIISILASAINLTFSIISLFCSFKARETNCLICSLANLFIPILGGLLTLKIHRKTVALWRENLGFKNKVNPARYLTFKAKQVLSLFYSDSIIPAQ